MNNTLKVALIVIAVLFGAAILVTGGVVLGRVITFRNAFANDANNSYQPFNMGGGMAGRGFFGQQDSVRFPFSSGQGMMGQRGFFGQGQNNQLSFGKDRGMMGQGFLNNQFTGEPATIEEARAAFDAWLTSYGSDDLQLNEIMIFSQNAYAMITEKSSGRGAMELLLDYASGNVYPEIGPNHMWNQKYGMMSAGRNTFGCGNGCSANPTNSSLSENTVTDAEAKSAAQAYLDANLSGSIVAGEGMDFYGYYTFDYSKDGIIAGMLSVNGNNAQVWPHTWHGQFVDEWELE